MKNPTEDQTVTTSASEPWWKRYRDKTYALADHRPILVITPDFRLEMDFGHRTPRQVWLELVAAFAAYDLPVPISQGLFFRLAAEREAARVRRATRRGYPS
ncbi:hypothetical protein J5277_28810 [Rhizobium sp. 16-449-1b]|uniref:hypothetical protein n=1 Tax=Rhizobium sp. 16-449-1b TaxID=2819989 RepID=UPI001ADD2AF4|nr:hypothetical protein [Rhizobium sp. 16-449-1b]MBO9198134.1 hypothetical protein [Rhizobium sp. 16-449-1b]